MAAEHIPLDMVQEILLWLPVRSVLRLRCVCKVWHSLTREENFIYSHLERSKSKPPRIILHANRFLHRKGDEVPDIFLPRIPFEDHLGFVGFVFLEETWRPELLLGNPACCYRNTRPCNGLVCFFNYYHADYYHQANIRLCNPATREVQILPDATLAVAWVQICSLGFAARTKEYKVVRLLDNRNCHYEIQILTVGSGSWRRVGDFSDCILENEEGVHVDGTIHWMVRFGPDCEAGMFCLDLTAEKLELVKFPDSVLQGGDGGELLCLAPWKGKLALVGSPCRPPDEPGVINVYTLQGHYKNNNVWNRTTFEPEEQLRAPNPFYIGHRMNRFLGVSFVGDEGILAFRSLGVFFYGYGGPSWSQIYGPTHWLHPQKEIYGLYEFQESLVPLEKSAMLCEYQFQHVGRRSRFFPV